MNMVNYNYWVWTEIEGNFLLFYFEIYKTVKFEIFNEHF